MYPGIKVNGNKLEEEIKEMQLNGNNAYYANQLLIRSKLISKDLKLRLHKSLIRLVNDILREDP